VHDGLLEVLEPVRYLARRHREQRAIAYAASMWERRSGTERRVAERRRTDAGPTGADEQRRAQRRSGRDRRRT
jgi:hypothetical protein